MLGDNPKAPGRSRAEEVYLSVPELAKMLNVPVPTIYKMNHGGSAPPRVRIGVQLRYPLSKVLEWIDARTEYGESA